MLQKFHLCNIKTNIYTNFLFKHKIKFSMNRKNLDFMNWIIQNIFKGNKFIREFKLKV